MTWYNSLCLWRWLPHRLSKRHRHCQQQSYSGLRSRGRSYSTHSTDIFYFLLMRTTHCSLFVAVPGIFHRWPEDFLSSWRVVLQESSLPPYLLVRWSQRKFISVFLVFVISMKGCFAVYWQVASWINLVFLSWCRVIMRNSNHYFLINASLKMYWGRFVAVDFVLCSFI